jgi:hypothetical protein
MRLLLDTRIPKAIMAKIKERTYQDTLTQLRERGFDVLEVPATPNRVFVKKMGCSAAIEKNTDNDGVRLFAKPGYLIAGEISRLVDKGYQKVLTTSKTEVPATADHLKAIHTFSEELREAMGATSLYNEALGTVSDRYVYDRVVGRDHPEPARKKRPWEVLKGKTKKGA